MGNLDLGITAANRQNWQENDARVIFLSILETAPDLDDEKEIQRRFREAAMTPRTIDSIKDYFSHQHYRNFKQTLERQRESPEARMRRAAKQQKVERDFDAAIQREAQRLLLDWIMPNGKNLGDCTADEARGVSAWIDRLCENLKGDDVIREHRSEDDARREARAARLVING